jgi:MFS family permease
VRLPRFPRPVVLLALTSLFSDVSTEMLYPVLPLFLTRTLSAPASVIGVVEGVAEATQNIVQGGSGALADRLRRNKPLALLGYGLSALSKPTIGLATAWPHVLAGRFSDRLGTGIRAAPRDALIANSIEERRRGAAFGLESLGDNLGAVLGPLLAAGLLYVLGVDLRLIFFIAFVPGALAFLLVATVREAPAPATKREAGVGIRQLPAGYWRYLLAVAAFGIGNSSNAFIILKAADIGLATEQTLLVYSGYNLVAALASYPAGRLSDRWGRKSLLLGALVVFALSYAGFAIATSGAVVAALFVLYGMYHGAFRAVGKAFAVDLVPGALRGSGVGLYGATVGLSALFASIVGGQLWDRLGPAATFGYGAACAVLGAVLLAAIVPARSGRAA